MSFQTDLIAQAAQRYPKFVNDQEWMRSLYFNYWNELAQYPADAAAKAMAACLDPWNGDAYTAFVMTHDGGLSVLRYLQNGGNPIYIIQPPPVDTRYAPQDDALQLEYVAKGCNPYGQPMDSFHLASGAKKWAAFASSRPQAAYAVLYDTARWLCCMDQVEGDFRANSTWDAYREKSIADVMKDKKFGYPA